MARPSLRTSNCSQTQPTSRERVRRQPLWWGLLVGQTRALSCIIATYVRRQTHQQRRAILTNPATDRNTGTAAQCRGGQYGNHNQKMKQSMVPVRKITGPPRHFFCHPTTPPSLMFYLPPLPSLPLSRKMHNYPPFVRFSRPPIFPPLLPRSQRPTPPNFSIGNAPPKTTPPTARKEGKGREGEKERNKEITGKGRAGPKSHVKTARYRSTPTFFIQKSEGGWRNGVRKAQRTGKPTLITASNQSTDLQRTNAAQEHDTAVVVGVKAKANQAPGEDSHHKTHPYAKQIQRYG